MGKRQRPTALHNASARSKTFLIPYVFVELISRPFRSNRLGARPFRLHSNPKPKLVLTLTLGFEATRRVRAPNRLDGKGREISSSKTFVIKNVFVELISRPFRSNRLGARPFRLHSNPKPKLVLTLSLGFECSRNGR